MLLIESPCPRQVFLARIVKMAYIRVDGHEVPLLFPIKDGEHARVCSHLLHIRFKFVECSIYVEEERMSESGEVKQFVPVQRAREEGGHCWYLCPGNYRAYGLPLSVADASVDILTRQSENSSVDMPCTRNPALCSLRELSAPIFQTPIVPHTVKVERLDPIIELSSESNHKSPKSSKMMPKGFHLSTDGKAVLLNPEEYKYLQ